MESVQAGAVGNLMAATETAGHDHSILWAIANGREEAFLANLHG